VWPWFQHGSSSSGGSEEITGPAYIELLVRANVAISVRNVLPLAYIGTASSTTQRDELEHRSMRFRLGGKKGAAGVCRGRGGYRDISYKYGVSIGAFLIGPHILHGCFSIRLFILTSTTARAANATATSAPAASFLSTIRTLRGFRGYFRIAGFTSTP
jgi:hypothetical protein